MRWACVCANSLQAHFAIEACQKYNVFTFNASLAEAHMHTHHHDRYIYAANRDIVCN